MRFLGIASVEVVDADAPDDRGELDIGEKDEQEDSREPNLSRRQKLLQM